MTAQFNDRCFHRKIDFSIAGISGSRLFDPADIGIEPVATSSACWRGYITSYSIIEGELFLTGLDIGLPDAEAALAKEGRGPELFGVLPVDTKFRGFRYDGFQSRIPFTGGLLLADDFIPDLYVHMGFHPAWKYKNVREVIFDAGRLTDDHDRSAEMAELRSRFVEEARQSGRRVSEPTRDQIKEWIEKCFSRSY